MAKTVINLSDTFAQLVAKSNTISNGLGDVAVLTTGDSNVVDAINSLDTRLSAFDDSAEIRALISASSADGLLSYSNSTGVITFGNVRSRFQKDSANGILFDSSTGAFSLAPNALSHTRFKSKVSLVIYDSTGSAVKTLYSPGA